MTTTSTPLIELKEEKEKPTWEAYQVLWANNEHNKLLPVSSWDDQEKRKQREKPTWNNDQMCSCTVESESIFNPDLNFDNDNDKDNSSSSVQNDNKKYNDLNPKTYIVLFDLTKEQELKWFSNNNKGIMSEHVHNTDAGFDLRYSRKDTIKLEPHLCICINLKIALEISATTMVQLAFRNSLVKKGINIRREIIDAEYIKNIIAMLQNDSEKTYIIEPNKKITQTIFLPLYIVVIERKVKDQVQIFEAEATLCKLEKIGLVNLYIPVKNHSHIKILIYNNTENIIKIPEETIIRYLTTEIEDQLPDTISDFSQLCGYVDITLQTIYE
ncbi:hypothetical protein G9A89_001199 [Geosiphon pyriformis]|nr:hypothetical protein G9A89_001199 [Geosiphon pyriformis]